MLAADAEALTCQECGRTVRVEHGIERFVARTGCSRARLAAAHEMAVAV